MPPCAFTRLAFPTLPFVPIRLIATFSGFRLGTSMGITSVGKRTLWGWGENATRREFVSDLESNPPTHPPTPTHPPPLVVGRVERDPSVFRVRGKEVWAGPTSSGRGLVGAFCTVRPHLFYKPFRISAIAFRGDGHTWARNIYVQNRCLARLLLGAISGIS